MLWFDSSAIASLRNLASCQAEVRTAKAIDTDGDGRGEYATFGELTGAGGVRLDAVADRAGPPLLPPILSTAFAGVGADGIVARSGYCFRIVLPGRAGIPVHEGLPGKGLSGTVDADGTEERWCAYAWPRRDYGESKGDGRFHNRVLFVDQEGDVWQSMNMDRRYHGVDHAPSWDAAMPEDGWGVAWGTAPREVREFRGRDGNLWTRVE